MCRHLGLSRIELLIVLLVLIPLIGVLLAALAGVRSEANLTNCQNNLRQLGIAVLTYQDAQDRLPPLTDQGAQAPTGRGLSSVFAILMPYLESTPLYFRPEQSVDFYNAHSSVVFTYPVKDEPFTQVGGMANHPHRLFLDPADPTAHELRDMPMTLPDGSFGYYATGNYAANGLLPWGTDKLPRSVPHGTANTVLFAERPQVCRTAEGDEVCNLWGLGVYSQHMPAFAALTPSEPPGLRSTGQVAPVEPLPAEEPANRDDRIRVRVGRRDADPEPLAFPTSLQMIRGKQPCDPQLPGGLHPSGMQVGMADGSVRLFGPDTSWWVFWASCLPGRPADRR